MNQAAAHPWPIEPARFSVGEYMAIAGLPLVAGQPGKLELVDGVITRMSPAELGHQYHARRLLGALIALFGEERDGLVVMHEVAFRFDDGTVRVPDIAVLRRPERYEGLADAGSLIVAIEIADASLAADLGPKRATYAAAGVPHYWVVDIRNRQTHIMSTPLDGDYMVRSPVPFDEPIPVPGGGGVTLD